MSGTFAEIFVFLDAYCYIVVDGDSHNNWMEDAALILTSYTGNCDEMLGVGSGRIQAAVTSR